MTPLPMRFALLALLAAPAAADVLTVAPGGAGADFATPQAAVDAAADGDIVRLAPGSFDGFTIDGTAVSVVSDGGTTITGPVRVEDVAAGDTVLLQNLEVAAPTVNEHPLTVLACEGEVIVDGCRFEGGISNAFARHGAFVAVSQSVTLTNSEFRGSRPFIASTPSGVGVSATASRIAIEDCLLIGGDGANAQGPEDGGDGGHGLFLGGSFGSVAGSEIRGGDGGAFTCGGSGCTEQGTGGHAIFVQGTVFLPGALRSRDLTLATGESEPGVVVSPIGTQGGFVTLIDAPAPFAAVGASSPVRLGETLELTLDGPPGDLAFLAFSLDATWLDLPGLQGVFHAAFPLVPNKLVPVGAFPGSGEIVLPLAITNLAGLEGLLVHVQLARSGPGGNTVDGTTTVAVLDSAF